MILTLSLFDLSAGGLEKFKKKGLQGICISDFSIPQEMFHKADCVIFINNKDYHVFKDRYNADNINGTFRRQKMGELIMRMAPKEYEEVKV